MTSEHRQSSSNSTSTDSVRRSSHGGDDGASEMKYDNLAVDYDDDMLRYLSLRPVRSSSRRISPSSSLPPSTSSLTSFASTMTTDIMRRKRGGQVGVTATPPTILDLPADVLESILTRVDLPSRLAVMCTCRSLNKAASEPSLWATVAVPKHRAYRVWDEELSLLVRRVADIVNTAREGGGSTEGRFAEEKPRGVVKRLHLSGSGITGKSLIRLREAGILEAEVEELHVDHCCNLKLCDVLAFVQSLTPFAASSSHGHNRHDFSTSSVSSSSSSSLCSSTALWDDLLHPSRVSREGVRILSMRVDGCKQVGPAEVSQLAALVGQLDVGVCGCGRAGVLTYCGRGRKNSLCEMGAAAATGAAASVATAGYATAVAMAGPADVDLTGPAAAAAVATLVSLAEASAARAAVAAAAGTPAGATAAFQQQQQQQQGGAAGGVNGTEGQCNGLCKRCTQLFKGCGVACGACCQPRSEQQVLRNRLRQWDIRQRELRRAVRTTWTDIRFGSVVVGR